jgi:hypothetical protein
MSTWWNKVLLRFATNVIRRNGFVVADIRNIGGTMYIVNNRGEMQRIGGKK